MKPIPTILRRAGARSRSLPSVVTRSVRQLPATAWVAIVGLILVAVGAWMIYPPAAFIIVGAVLMLEAATNRSAAPRAFPPKEKQ